MGDTGPKGDIGPPGPATGLAGGDLTGSYPAPTIAPGAVTPSKIGVIPAARITETGAGGFSNGQQTIVTMGQVVFDNDSVFTTSGGGPALTAPIAGVYEVDAGLEWAANSSGNRFIGLDVNSTCCFGASWVPASTGGDPTIENVTDLLKLNAGDRVLVIAIQDSGGTLNVNATGGTYEAMHWVSP